jgi:lipopolysaccharide biosynthesis regulator YciM
MKGKNASTDVDATREARADYGDAEQPSGQRPSQRKRNRRGLTITIAGLSLALLAAGFVISYGSKLYENWHERALLEKATRFSREGNLSKAAEMAQEFVRRHPDSVAALSILADTAEKQNLEEAVAWRERIARLLPKDPESQLNVASAALRFGNLDVAREALNRISAKDRESAPFHVVAGWLARAEGNFAEQEEQFAAAVKEEPKNDLYQFNLAALQIRSKDTEKSSKARDTLERLSAIAPYRTGALRALLNDAVDRNDRTAADNFAQQLQMSPEVTFTDYLLCLNFYRKLDEKKFRQVLDKVKPFATRNASDLASLINWMNQNGLAGDVVKWTDKLGTARLNSPPASVAVADAFATVKNWPRLKRWTRTGDWGDAQYLRLAYDAIAERHVRSGNGSEFQTLWQSAMKSAVGEPERQLTLARFATRWQLANEAEDLWVQVEQNPTMRREALDNLRELYRAQDETTKLYSVLERLHESSPNEAPITADLARLGLNLDENTERSHQLAKEAYDRAPDDVSCAVTYAYSLHRLGRDAEALAIVQSLPPEHLHDVGAAVYIALVLAGGNELDRAKDCVVVAESGKLYPEERKLLQEAKARLTAMSATASPTESPSPGTTPSPL